MDRTTRNTHTHGLEEGRLMGKIEKEVPEKKEFLGLTAEATGKERLYNAK